MAFFDVAPKENEFLFGVYRWNNVSVIFIQFVSSQRYKYENRFSRLLPGTSTWQRNATMIIITTLSNKRSHSQISHEYVTQTQLKYFLTTNFSITKYRLTVAPLYTLLLNISGLWWGKPRVKSNGNQGNCSTATNFFRKSK